ncbi:DNA-binding protein, partial [Butyricicoccus sp. 1XD8-22]
MENKHPFEDSFNNFNNEKSGTITVKEAAAALQLSEATVYKYIRDGLLESVELSFADTMRIKLESFQKLLTNLGNTKAENGISLNALAKRMNITKSRLQQILDSNNIEIPKILHGRREQYLITEEIQNQIHDILLNAGHFPKTHFFYSRWNIALYQAFTSKLTHNIYRIERDGNTWGIRTPTGILPFDVAEQQYELVPNYSLRQRARISDTVIT